MLPGKSMPGEGDTMSPRAATIVNMRYDCFKHSDDFKKQNKRKRASLLFTAKSESIPKPLKRIGHAANLPCSKRLKRSCLFGCPIPKAVWQVFSFQHRKGKHSLAFALPLWYAIRDAAGSRQNQALSCENISP
jgi:hypothetical protein